MRSSVKHLFSAFLCLLLLLSLLPTATSAASDTVYVSDSGSDTGNGTASAPYLSLEKALSEVKNGGTVSIVGTVSLPSGFTWSSHGKTVTISGGTLDIASLSGGLVLGDNVTFDNTTLKFASGASLYANGYKLTVNQNVTVTNPIVLYGGGKSGTTVASTNVRLLAGTYTAVYGGSNAGTVSGDTNLYIGGSVNASIDATNHGLKNYIYGGGYNDTINGDTNVTFAGDAKAIQVFGGSHGSSAVIKGETNLNFVGGHSMGLYGGNNGVNTAKAINVNFTGGYIEQIFGGCYGTSYTGNVYLSVLGGTVSRRIYGGCYNNYESFSWKSSYSVTGNITLTIGGNANITLDYDDNDLSIYARSRYKSKFSSEYGTIVFADETAYNNYKGKLGAQDLVMRGIMISNSAADAKHYYTYTADDTAKTITEKCAFCTAHAATATLSLDNSVSLVYTGKEIKPAKVTHSSDWETDTLSVSYQNNKTVGTATASCEKNGASVSLTFTIEKATQSAPTLGKTDETVKDKADGKITGLTTAMEYSTDGIQFTAVTDPNMQFPAGSYSVRYAETATHHASPVATVTIGSGRMLTVTFKAEGSADVVKEVAWNGTLSDIPEVPVREGYTETAPYWDTTVFTNIQSDMTVTAVYTKDAEQTTGAVTETTATGTTEVLPSPETTQPPATESTTETIPEVTDPITTVPDVTTTQSVVTESTTEPSASSTDPATDPIEPTGTNAEISTDDEIDVADPIGTESNPEASMESESVDSPETDASSDNGAPVEEKGCGATLGTGALIICLLFPAAAVCLKKNDQ